jgi:HPt (histidine-containing phosphotransfer) domain-containing protein
VEGMDVESALLRMGGLSGTYEKTIKLLARLLPDTITKMDNYLAENNLKDFTIEMHGLKGALRNVGAIRLGSEAGHFEEAGLAGNADYCIENYPHLKGLFVDFSKILDSALEENETDKETDAPKQKISKEEFADVLTSAKEAAEAFDAMGAVEVLSPLLGFDYDFKINEETNELLKQIIFALEVFDCKGAIINIKKMEEIL